MAIFPRFPKRDFSRFDIPPHSFLIFQFILQFLKFRRLRHAHLLLSAKHTTEMGEGECASRASDFKLRHCRKNQAGWRPARSTQRVASAPAETANFAASADATWYGTLAAARDLGAHGVTVTLASDIWVAPERWSRHVARTISCPSSKDPARFLAWLPHFGAARPGHVLYPTSDEVAWQKSRLSFGSR